MRCPTARLGYAFRLYLLFATAAALHFALAISRSSKRGTAAGSGTKRRRKQCLVLNKEKESVCMYRDN